MTVPAPSPRRLDSERLARRREVRADRAVRGQRQPANVGTRAAAPRPTGKRRAALGAAVKTTSLPPAKLASQLPPQSIPEGELVTVPAPFPVVSTASVCVSRAGAKSALTERFASASACNVGTRAAAPSNRQTSSALGAGSQDDLATTGKARPSCRRNRSPRANS